MYVCSFVVLVDFCIKVFKDVIFWRPFDEFSLRLASCYMWFQKFIRVYSCKYYLKWKIKVTGERLVILVMAPAMGTGHWSLCPVLSALFCVQWSLQIVCSHKYSNNLIGASVVCKPVPEVIKLFLCSTQLSMKCFMLINLKINNNCNFSFAKHSWAWKFLC